MLFYRIALKRLIDYLGLDELFKEDERRLILLHKKPKKVYKTVLKTDQTLNFYVSILLSVIGLLICLSIPFAAVENPCEIFKERELYFLYEVAKWIEAHFIYLDLLILILSIALVFVSVKTVRDAIKNTNISISPWIERGKYTVPPKTRGTLKSYSILEREFKY